ncbi:hypothetical protein [Sulfoacidibacillus thermotolerans]|uniref:Peptidase M48 domain-containing protein n=1 Tax=Sulfoacidibacillus thermotolerans TaxID=1765684 RepID=A0A2U3D6K2_SULT2|nr:hypothetical protein [Sulfoacidibacillus thermotolerans]PWI56914.1 hypothetical protein BM613_11365 [Sulfoacidibacillus thermotolerans]
MTETTLTCPKCSAQVPMHYGYITWCECGWQLDLPTDWEEDKRLRAKYRRAQQVYENVRAKRANDPLLWRARLVITLVGMLVFAWFIFYLGITFALFKLHTLIATLLGSLLALGLFLPFEFLWKFPECTTPLTQKHAPQGFARLNKLTAVLNRSPITRLDIMPNGMQIRTIQPLLRRQQCVQISLPLLYLLDDELLLLGIARELHLHRYLRRKSIAGAIWAQKILTLASEIIRNDTPSFNARIPHSMPPVHETYRFTANVASSRSTIYFLQMLTRPLSFIPQALAQLLDSHLAILQHRAIYEIDQTLADQYGTHALVRYFEVLSLATPVRFARTDHPYTANGRIEEELQSIRQRISTLLRRERERLLRTAPEDDLERPLLWWQIECITPNASTIERTSNNVLPHSLQSGTTQLITELLQHVSKAKERTTV